MGNYLTAFPLSYFDETVTHLPRVLTRGEYAEDIETWPGPGTVLPAKAVQGTPMDREGHQVLEVVTGWVVWFPFAEVAASNGGVGVVFQLGDRLTSGGNTLRITAPGTDYGNQNVVWYVQAEQVV